MNGQDDLSSLVDQKEAEWKTLLNLRIETLEKSLSQTKNELWEERKQFEKLKEDFKFNLGLLNESQNELDAITKMNLVLQHGKNEYEAENGEIKKLLEEYRIKLQQELLRNEELHNEFQCKLQEKHQEYTTFKKNKLIELEKEKEEVGIIRRNIGKEKEILVNDLEIQKTEMIAEFEETIKNKEYQYQLELDKLKQETMGYEMKLKLLNNELQLSSQKVTSLSKRMEENEKNKTVESEKQNKLECMLEDTRLNAATELAKLEDELITARKSLARQEKVYKARLLQLGELAAKKEEELVQLRRQRNGDARELKIENESLKKKLKSCIEAQRKLRGQLDFQSQTLASSCFKGDELVSQVNKLNEFEEENQRTIQNLEERLKEFTSAAQKEDSEQISNLKQQNEGLKSALREMRKEMENVQVDDGEVVRNLRSQLLQLQEVNQKLMDNKLNLNSDNILIHDHFKQLNSTIAQQKNEKVELMTTCRQLQARVSQLGHSCKVLEDKNDEHAVAIRQMDFSLNTERQQHQIASASQLRQIEELKGQLFGSQQAAEEYMKSNIAKDSEITKLTNQISSLKIDLAHKNPSINLGAQELLIQQLERELTMMRSQAPVSEGADNENANEKLNKAAQLITKLAREKEQLLQLSNKLRSALNKAEMNGAASSGGQAQNLSHMRLTPEKDSFLLPETARKQINCQGRFSESSNSASLQDVWKVLSENEKLNISSDSLVVKGKKPSVGVSAGVAVKAVKGMKKPPLMKRKPKIRNYNIKDSI